MDKESIQSWDSRRDFIVPGDAEQTIAFAVEHWIHTAQRSIQQKGRFAVALTGGSTPKPIYQRIAQHHKDSLDWKKVHLFWVDERNVPLDNQNSNYHMTMESGFKHLPIPPNQIHPMRTHSDAHKSAADYDDLIHRILGPHCFDLVMLGVGEDGHTASLFPRSEGLLEDKKLVIANLAPEQNQWRITCTFPCINKSAHVNFYLLGTQKQAIVPIALNAAIVSPFPASRIGTDENKALWIIDRAAAHLLTLPNDAT